MNSVQVSLGGLVANALCGSWRTSPPELQVGSGTFNRLAPLLLGSGTGGLGWWKVRGRGLAALPRGVELFEAYRLQTLHAALHRRSINQVFSALHSVGVEPILAKGWAIALHYPEEALRPYGDIDLYLRPGTREAAVKALRESEVVASVDLHTRFVELSDRTMDQVYCRSQLIELDGSKVRVLSNEDHFGLLCVHMLKHGAWRALWLCDIALLLETIPPDFDWEYCLGKNGWRANWIACAAGLAHQLLGARVSHTPLVKRAEGLPSWLVPTVLKEWGAPLEIYKRYGKVMGTYLKHPAGLIEGLRSRWPNPIEATVLCRGPFSEAPRFPFQVYRCVSQIATFACDLPKLLQQQNEGPIRSAEES